MKCLAWGCAAAALLVAQIGLAAEPATTRTVKERLSSKANDNQRVDNCKVPLELRGPKSRPDCRERPGATPAR